MDPSASPSRGCDVDDAVLARRAGLGDREAFGEIVDRHGSRMYRLARRLVSGDQEAEDVVQDVLLAAWRGLPSFRGDASLRSWLLTSTANRSRTVRRRRRAVPVDDALLTPRPGPDHLGPARQVVAQELVEALDEALAELPWRQRAAWLLFEIEGHSYAEIARTLQTSEAVVRGQLHRGRRTLAARMARWR